MTPTCTEEACGFRDHYGSLEQAGAVVIGISPDPLNSHAKFIDKHSLPYLLLSDEEHKVSEMFDVWQMKKMFGREYMGIVRSTFLIDEQGKLAAEWRKVKVKVMSKRFSRPCCHSYMKNGPSACLNRHDKGPF